MGLFRSVKDRRVAVGVSPGLMNRSSQISTNARVMQLAPAHVYRVPSPPPAPARAFESIAGVDLATYANIAASLARHGFDQYEAVGFAASQGIDSASWQAALDGWNQRIAAHPAVAQRFHALFIGRC
jgi:hypothetical protein